MCIVLHLVFVHDAVFPFFLVRALVRDVDGDRDGGVEAVDKISALYF